MSNSRLQATSFPGSLILPLAPGGGKTRAPGNEVGLQAKKTQWLRQPPHNTGKITKRRFISTVRPTFHTNHHENGVLRKRSLDRRNLKKLILKKRILFSRAPSTNYACTENLFENDDVTIITWFPRQKFPQAHIQKWPVIVVLNFSSVVWTQNIWCDFRVNLRFHIPTAV